MAMQLHRAFGVRCIYAGVEKATPRTWEGDQNRDIRNTFDDVRDLSVSAFRCEVIFLGNVDDIARLGVWVRPLHIRVLIGA